MPPEIRISDTHYVKCWLYEHTVENRLKMADYKGDENDG